MKLNYYVFGACLSITLFSCNSSLPESTGSIESVQKNVILPDSDFQSSQERKEYFAKILAKAVVNKDVRSFLKNQSLKMFDNDYDILYELVRDEEVSGGKTFEELLKSYATSETLFTNIVNEEPLLTIYIPELKEWDAIKWNSESEIPLVAVRNEKSAKMQEKAKAYDHECNLLFFDYYESPERPIIVIKDNERVEVQPPFATKSFNELQTDLIIKETQSRVYSFALKDFDGLSPKINTKTVYIGPTYGWEKEKLLNSQFVHYYTEIVGNSAVHTPDSPRDYIYYGISSKDNVTTGQFNNNPAEYIRGFYINNSTSLSYIADNSTDSPSSNWTEGRLEFFINIFFTGRDGAITSLRKGFSCKTGELFGRGDSTFFKDMDIEIVPWDMYKYGDTWKFHVYEYDPGTETTQTVQTSSNFSYNFNADAGFNIGVVKIGAKAGTSKTETKTNSTIIKMTDTSDDLGEAILSFSDPISLGNVTYPNWDWIVFTHLKGINTGFVSLLVMPKSR